MTRIIDHQHIAILYETVTGQHQKRGSISIDGDDKLDLDKFLSLHPGLDAVVVERKSHPGPDQNEHFCRQVIAAHTGKPYFPHKADRAVMVHGKSRKVVSVHYGNVPGLDKSDPGHELISHQVAEVGDVHRGQKTFMRDGKSIT